MFSHLLSKLPAPRLSDWGLGMTVCIAAMAEDKRIVTVSDQKISMRQFSGDNLTLKLWVVARGWNCMVAGSDVTIAQSIIDRVAVTLSQKFDTLELEDVVAGFKQSYQEQIQSRATDTYLARYKMGMDEFRTKGRRQLGPDVFDTLCDKIARVSFDLRFLVAGFDRSSESPHLFVISNPGVEEIYDRPGFWAIGSGAMSALSMLFYRGQKVIASLEQTIYNVCEAKFMAESASDVGEETFLHIMSPPSKKQVKWSPLTPTEIRAVWKSDGAPRVPEGIVAKIGHGLTRVERDKTVSTDTAKPSASQPSEPEKSK
jgi:hypothetical protein